MQLVIALLASAAALAPRTAMDRRTAFKVGTGAAALPFVPAAAQAKGGKKVVVVGTGFVASYVARDLAKAGASVTTVSRSSPDAQREKVAKFVGALPDKAVTYVSADAATADLSAVFKGADAVVSCVGVVPGGKNQLAGNGAVNVAIADAAAKSKVPKMVRERPTPPRPTPPRRSTSASRARSPTVRASSSSVRGRQFSRFPVPPLPTAGDYMKGKAQAEAAVKRDFGDYMILKPAIISGGPPGPPGPPGVPPVPVEAVAKAAVAGALGKASGVFDGADAIIKL